MKKKYNLANLVSRKRPERLVLIMRLSMVLIFSAIVFSASALPLNNNNKTLTNTLIQQKITGTVTDAATGEPLIGVSVQVTGTTIGSITDANGKYSLDAPKGAVISFSFMGYVTETITVSGPTVDVKLVADVKKLEEVVVIGYGSQRKESVTGSVASIKGDGLRDVPASNISTALQGRLPGVDMSQTSTRPGATMQIRIRGTRSLNATNDPLLVLDGIPFSGSISDINPNDIKSIDILKDASATAIYGSRGSNGVILVTTTKGSKGQKAQITYNGSYGPKFVFNYLPMMDGPTFLKLRTVANVYTSAGAPTFGADEAADVNTDWQKLFYRTGSVQSHNLAIAGGTEKGNYKVSLGYDKEEAVVPGQDFSRITLRASVDQEIGKYVKAGLTSTNNYSINNGNNIPIGNVLSMSPLANPYNADGTWKRTITMPADVNWNESRDIINNLGNKWIDQTKSYGSYNSVYAEVKIPGVEGLKYRANIGLNLRYSTSGQYTGQGVFSNNAATVSTAAVTNSLSTGWTMENLLTYDRTFAKKHQVSAVLLYSAEENKYNSSNMSAMDIPADAFQFYNIGRAAGTITVDPNNQNYWVTGLMSYMGRVNYTYDNRYMLMASVRQDGSSRLAPGHKWVSYPAVSAGWNVANESFMKNISNYVDQLKLRAGYGVTSNQSINPYSTLGLLSSNPMNLGTQNTTAYYVSALPNPALGWELTSEMNYAVDFSFLKGRLSGSLEYYQTDTKDLLLSVNLPPTTGVNSYTANVGESQNKGWEFSLNGTILNNLNGWTWEAGINIYDNRNKLLALASGAQEDRTNYWFVGHPIDVIWDYKAVGIWQQGDPFLTNYETTQSNVGQIKVKYTGTYNADGSPTRFVGDADKQIMKIEPNYQGGFNTRVAYKGFDLSIVGAFKNGGLLIATPYGSAGYMNILTARRANIDVDYWTPTNTGAKFPKPGGVGGDSPKYLNSLSYMDASYMKIRTITLGYNFEGNKWFKKTGIDRMRLYVTAQNPFVLFSPFYKFSGMDPETNSYGNENAAVPLSYNLRRLLTIGTNTPSTRNYLVGISLTF